MGGVVTSQEHELVLDVLQIADAAFAVNASQQIVAWNDAAERLLGYRADEVLGAHCFDILTAGRGADSHECRFHCVTFISHASTRGARTPSQIETPIKTNAGTQKWISLTILEAHTAQGQSRVIHLMRDVTEYHHLRETTWRLERMAQSPTDSDPHLKAPARAASVTGAPATNGRASAIHPPHEPPDASGVTDQETARLSAPMRRASLTPREHEVLRLLACGMATDEIAQKLSISRVTARNHVNKVIEKLGVSSRLQAVVVASQRNLI
ncbi:MAG TPA: PAS and helix-turn-helix domain-containing protein [Ktedonobacterales bacterium]|nr:PAS and helix-turn-helix domain-containing protein [Ktedonobacterales bacterium]